MVTSGHDFAFALNVLPVYHKHWENRVVLPAPCSVHALLLALLHVHGGAGSMSSLREGDAKELLAAIA